MHISNICLNWSIVVVVGAYAERAQGMDSTSCDVPWMHFVSGLLKDALHDVAGVPLQGDKVDLLQHVCIFNWLIRFFWQRAKRSCYFPSAASYLFNFDPLLFPSSWGTKHVGPRRPLHPPTESKEVSVMNGMLPQRRAVATSGYSSGETTFQMCFGFLVLFYWNWALSSRHSDVSLTVILQFWILQRYKTRELI